MWFSLFLAAAAVVMASTAAAPGTPVVRSVTPPVDHGEGCYWDDRTQVLYFVDIAGELVNRYNPATGQVTNIHFEGGGVSLVVPVAGSLDELVVTRGHDVLLVRWDGKSAEPESVKVIISVEADKPGNRFNDGKADTTGRLWLGTMGPEPVPGDVTPNQGSLYSVDTNSDNVVTHLSPVSVSNGLIWSHDDKFMYYIDSPTEHVDVFDYDIVTGDISNRRTVFDLTSNNITGVPDGMTIDANDNLWVAVFNGAKVLNVNPRTGELLRVVDIPADRVTDVVFGGSDLSTLYVTTSRYGLSDDEVAQQPLAGTVFEVTGLGVRGVAGHTAIRSVPPQ
ncbi:hypothetical protein R5R35_004911 [Gryllus longicercus]|uniref:Regucalcin n=1 Tax=Gryllus longicercus TaxID=2509291 RepID=A0AAN9VI41_9ORTH